MEYTEVAYWGKVFGFSDSLHKVAERALKGKKFGKRHLGFLENAERFFDSCRLAAKVSYNPEEWVDDSNLLKVFIPTVHSDDSNFYKNPKSYLALLSKLRRGEEIGITDAKLLKEFSSRMTDYAVII